MFSQVQIFLISCVFGFFLGVIYDVLSINRIFFKNNNYNIFLQDIIYFGIAGTLTFLFILSINSGEVRFYILFGELVGVAVYYVTLRKILNKFIFLFTMIIVKFIRKIYRIIIYPLFIPIKKLRLFCIKKKNNIAK